MLRQVIWAGLLAAGATGATAQEDYGTLLTGDPALGTRAHSVTTGAQVVSLQVPIPAEGAARFGVLLQQAPGDGGLAAFTYHTPERGLIESLHLSTAIVPAMDDPQARLESLRSVLRGQAVPALQERIAGMQVETTRNMQVGGLPAVELTGTATHPQHGALRWRLLGVLNPNGADSLYALNQVATAALPVTGPENFGQSLGGRMLETLRFE